MKQLKSLLLILILVALVGVIVPLRPAYAQNSAVVLVYADLNDNIQLFDSSTGASRTLIAAQAGRRIEYRLLLSPDRTRVAVYSYSFDLAAARAGDNTTVQDTLQIFSLPDGESVLAESLMLPNLLGVGVNEDEFPPMNINDFMAWSPDGSQFAWITNNPGWNTIHVFFSGNPAQSVLSLIASDTSVGQLSKLRWSPDGSQLAYTSVTTFVSEDGGPQTSGLYTFALNAESPEAVEISSTGYWFLGWDSSSSLLWSPFGVEAGASGLIRHDLATASDTEIIPTTQPLSRAAIDLTTQTVAFAVPNLSIDGTPQAGLTPGAYVIGADDQPEQVFAADNLFGVSFIQSGLLAVGNDTIIRLRDNTQFNLNLLRRAIFSPDGTQAVGEKESKTFLRDLATEAESEIYSLYFVDGAWLDSSTVLMKVGAYGSVIGVWRVGGNFTQLVEDSGDGPFVGVLR